MPLVPSSVLSFGGRSPVVDPDAVVMPTATLIGDVEVGPRSSIWYGAVIRADAESIRIGCDTNVQDGAVFHADPGFPAVVGRRVTVGHGAVVHGATVEDDCIIGMRAVLLNGAHVERGCVVAAGSVVGQGVRIPAGSMAAGVPAAVKRPVRDTETAQIDRSWSGYVELARAHAAAQAAPEI